MFCADHAAAGKNVPLRQSAAGIVKKEALRQNEGSDREARKTDFS